MAEQTEDVGRLEQPHDSVSDHALFTQMLFIDAIVGVGFPCNEAAVVAEHAGLADCDGDQYNTHWSWRVSALWEMSLEALQTLYGSLKMYEVTHAG